MTSNFNWSLHFFTFSFWGLFHMFKLRYAGLASQRDPVMVGIASLYPKLIIKLNS